MAEISKITLPSGTTYDLKDATARAAIDALSGYVTYAGVTTTALSDGSTTNPVVINGQNVTATTGTIVTYGNKEFVWNGSAWQEFGDLSALGAMANADTASGSYTPAGSVNLTNGNVKATVSPAASGQATYTPAGSVGAPAISLETAGSTATIKNPTKKTVATAVTAAAPGATAPSNAITYYSVANETLSLYQLGYNTGDSISTSDVSVKTGDGSYSASAPSFSGTGVRLETDNISVPSSASFTGTPATITVEPDEE